MTDSFRSPRHGLVECDTYSVEVVPGFREPVTLRYAEADRIVQLDGELVGDWLSIRVLRGNLRSWQAPQDEVSLSESERDLVLDRMRLALDWEGTKLEVVEDRVFPLSFDPETLARAKRQVK
jgi:hypothetical protein